MRILTFTTLYPNSSTPLHGVFVENRLRKLVSSTGVEARVIAPVPWFPFAGARFGRYAAFARVPATENRFGITVDHPRFFLFPKIGMSISPATLFAASKRKVSQLLEEGVDFDAIDAHYFYPDGVAAVLLGLHFKKPVVVTARGSDLTLLARHFLPREMIKWAAGRADALITVSAGLREELCRLGVAAQKVTVLRNGVDLELFRPVDRKLARRELGIDRSCLVSVGNLITRKGHDLAIEALVSLPDFMLLIVGEGPERGNLEAIASRLGLGARVRFLGATPHERMREVYGAADASILASSREGWANVLLESMACGTPVIASDIPGTREVVGEPASGRLMRDRNPQAIVEAVRAMFAAPIDRSATRAYAERFSWDATTSGQLAIIDAVCAERRGRPISDG
jgi:teichuronic acid biosynthesis glycosyltransferase TuaC